MTILYVHIIDGVVPKIRFPHVKYDPFVLFIESRIVNLLFSILFLITSIHFFLNFSINFRHKVAISESGGLIIIMFFFRIYFKVFILKYLFYFFNGIKIRKSDRFILFLVLLGFLFSLNSSWDAIFIFVLIVILLKKEGQVFYTPTIKNIKAIAGKYFKVLLVVITLFAVVFIGYANKIGSENTIILFSQTEILFLKVIKRLSVWYISVLTAGVNFFENSYYALEPLAGTVESVFYRVQVLVGMETSKPEVWSVNRMNFLHLFIENTNPRTGSSPGVFASVFYLPLFPLNTLVIASFIVYILRKFTDALKAKKNKISTSGLFVMVFFLVPLFESPVNLINILDKPFIYFLFFLAIVRSINYRRYLSILKS